MGDVAAGLSAAKHRRILILGGLLAVLTGFSLVMVPGHDLSLRWLGLALLVAALAAFAWGFWPEARTEIRSDRTLASRLINAVTRRGRLRPYFPVLGVVIIASDIGYNAFLSSTPALLTEDVIVLLFGATLLAYPLVPSRLGRERDFVLVFFIALNAILVVPVLLTRLLTGNLDASVDLYSWVALAPETAALLNLMGISASVVSVPGATAPGLVFTLLHTSVSVTVVITAACSGIYSFGIFAAAFSAYVSTEFETVSRKVWLLLALGFATSYAANILRMVVIVLVGYYSDSAQTDLQNMLIAHSYAGWIIFLGWISLFWVLLWHWIPAHDMALPRSPHEEGRTRGTICSVCLQELSVAIPANRCSCGAFYHIRCLDSAGSCPSCGSKADLEGPDTLGQV